MAGLGRLLPWWAMWWCECCGVFHSFLALHPLPVSIIETWALPFTCLGPMFPVEASVRQIMNHLENSIGFKQQEKPPPYYTLLWRQGALAIPAFTLKPFNNALWIQPHPVPALPLGSLGRTHLHYWGPHLLFLLASFPDASDSIYFLPLESLTISDPRTVPFPGFPQLFECSFSQIWTLNSFKGSFGERKRHGCPCSPTILPFGWMSLAVARGTEVLSHEPRARVPA